MRIGVYAGSFDGPTRGHWDIVMRGLSLVDRIHTSIGMNPEKSGGMFNVDERIEMLEHYRSQLSPEDQERVVIDSYSGLLIDHAERIGANIIIRGLRAVSDFEYEFTLNGINAEMNPNIQTVFLMASTEFLFVSSRNVKGLIAMGDRDVSKYVPPYIEQKLRERLRK